MTDKIKILITSVGSLVSQNILDVFEYHKFYRRDKVTVTGTNSLAENPNNFRCDNCYLVPNTGSKDFDPVMREIIKEAKPDLILNGRDEDTAALWRIKESDSGIKVVLPYGSLKTIMYALDKWQTWLFTQKHGLPFAETMLSGNTNTKTENDRFIEKVKFPMIAKPIRGFASKGVFYIRDHADMKVASGLENYIIQEFLGDPADLVGYFSKIDSLTPLYAHTPNDYLYSCQTIISPHGEISPVSVSYVLHEFGKTIMIRKHNDEQLKKVMTDYAEAYFAEGGTGPMGVQFRKDQNGIWKGWEVNARTNGNTFARFILGQDDLGLIIKYFLPGRDFPVYAYDERSGYDIIYKTLTCSCLRSNITAELNNNKKWFGIN
jgi:hypothetical protein